MSEQAPYDYIADYYARVHEKNAAFPEIADFWLSGFRLVTGARVLNLGCGPMFYDNLARFGDVPKTYVGVDLNEQTFAFLKNGDHPELIKHRKMAEAAGIEMSFVQGDAIAYLETQEAAFDTILGIGFFATFSGETFKRLISGCRRALVPGGTLLKMTWHGSIRTQAETAAKIKYRYDNEVEPAGEELVREITSLGFETASDETFICPPDTIGWRSIQVAAFRKPLGDAT
ncbi:MAG: methyltransferase domain-containing protein [Pseudomonadota bacterium]